MYQTNDYQQTEHDQVVAARAKQLELFYKVNAKPDSAGSAYIKGLYPDIIVMDKKNNVLFIEEVETESSITEKERDERWVSYSKLGYPFNLIVPRSQILKARQLLYGLNINKLYYYDVINKPDIRFRLLSKLIEQSRKRIE